MTHLTIPLSSTFNQRFINRFWSCVDQSGGPDACWEWTRSKKAFGHGRVSLHGRDLIAHRVAYVLTHGDVPMGTMVCHACDNPACCNPRHLWAGTQGDNVRDCVAKGRNAYAPRRGEEHPKARLTEAEVLEIRRLYRRGEAGYRRLAVRFGVTPMAIKAIVVRRSWDHLPEQVA